MPLERPDLRSLSAAVEAPEPDGRDRRVRAVQPLPADLSSRPHGALAQPRLISACCNRSFQLLSGNADAECRGSRVGCRGPPRIPLLSKSFHQPRSWRRPFPARPRLKPFLLGVLASARSCQAARGQSCCHGLARHPARAPGPDQRLECGSRFWLEAALSMEVCLRVDQALVQVAIAKLGRTSISLREPFFDFLGSPRRPRPALGGSSRAHAPISTVQG